MGGRAGWAEAEPVPRRGAWLDSGRRRHDQSVPALNAVVSSIGAALPCPGTVRATPESTHGEEQAGRPIEPPYVTRVERPVQPNGRR